MFGIPFGERTHLGAGGIQGDFRSAFNNKFIIDLNDNEALGERANGESEEIPADCQDDVLPQFHELVISIVYKIISR